MIRAIEALRRRRGSLGLAVLFVGTLHGFLRAADQSPAPKTCRTENVVILVLDGERYTETWGDPKKEHIPNRARKMAKEGVVLTKFMNNGPTETNPGHAAITTGFYQPKLDNAGLSSPAQPSIFQLWRRRSGAKDSAAWVITSKDKLVILGDSAAAEWQGKFIPKVNCGVGGGGRGGYRGDADTMDEVLKTLKADHPRLLLINLKEPDSAGHAGDWQRYLAAIRGSDESAWKLFEFLQQDPFYAGKTAFFLTNDHGRHSEDFAEHGCGCEGCRHLFFFASGPDFKKNVVSEAPAELVDLPATVAQLMGFTIPDAQGRVLKELFAPAEAPPVPAPATEVNTSGARR
jgi:hypothetical protein